ncbi:MAG TPA: hypothetical protein VFP86_14280, partial [bacterium]|nr:hypothetical protein [bacterium]
RGLVSPEQAREEYGVVLRADGTAVDPEATGSLRRTMAAERSVQAVDRGSIRPGPPPGRLVEVDPIPGL